MALLSWRIIQILKSPLSTSLQKQLLLEFSNFISRYCSNMSATCFTSNFEREFNSELQSLGPVLSKGSQAEPYLTHLSQWILGVSKEWEVRLLLNKLRQFNLFLMLSNDIQLEKLLWDVCVCLVFCCRFFILFVNFHDIRTSLRLSLLNICIQDLCGFTATKSTLFEKVSVNLLLEFSFTMH